MKSVLHPALAGFHRNAISPTEGGFHPSVRTDFVEKKRFCLVDKKRFFHGWGGGIRTHAYSSQSAVSYRLTTTHNMARGTASGGRGREDGAGAGPRICLKNYRKITNGLCDNDWGG